MSVGRSRSPDDVPSAAARLAAASRGSQHGLAPNRTQHSSSCHRGDTVGRQFELGVSGQACEKEDSVSRPYQKMCPADAEKRSVHRTQFGSIHAAMMVQL
jgi:hypothetical protein